jgi:hypothetical protein
MTRAISTPLSPATLERDVRLPLPLPLPRLLLLAVLRGLLPPCE